MKKYRKNLTKAEELIKILKRIEYDFPEYCLWDEYENGERVGTFNNSLPDELMPNGKWVGYGSCQWANFPRMNGKKMKKFISLIKWNEKTEAVNFSLPAEVYNWRFVDNREYVLSVKYSLYHHCFTDDVQIARVK